MRISDWSSDVCSSDLPKIKDPPSVHVLANRGRAGAIDAHIGYGCEQINNKRCSATRNRTGRAGRQRHGSSWQIEVEASNRGPQPKRLILDPIAWRGIALTLLPAMLAGHRARRRAVPERKKSARACRSEDGRVGTEGL